MPTTAEPRSEQSIGDVTGFPTDEDRARLRKALSEQAPVWEEQFKAGPGIVIALEDAVVVAARVLAVERRSAFNEGAVAGLKLERESRG
jgi:hypothetical protein